MNLFRILIIVAIVWISYRMYINWKTKKSLSNKQPNNKQDIKNMVQCATCGVHLPEQEAVKQSDKFYCCEAHRH